MNKFKFIQEIQKAIEDRPKIWRKGQAVFNYIESKYNIARNIQFNYNIDCFYDDKNIPAFIDKAYELLSKEEIHDFPGNNMIEE